MMEAKYLVVMNPISDHEELCHPCESFKTFKEAERYSQGIFQIVKIPSVSRCWK